MDFQFTDEEYNYVIRMCTDFAHKEYETTKYQRARRNQNNKDRIIQQTITGKVGEFAVMFFLLEKNNEVSTPDMTVTYNKSFDADLTCNKIPLHVKSQRKESSDKFGVSWTFQKGGYGHGHTDPLTNKSLNEDVVFCHVDGKYVKIYGPYPWTKVKPLLRDPMLKRLKGIKECIYLEDLKTLC